jgi:hypothetical protein
MSEAYSTRIREAANQLIKNQYGEVAAFRRQSLVSGRCNLSRNGVPLPTFAKRSLRSQLRLASPQRASSQSLLRIFPAASASNRALKARHWEPTALSSCPCPSSLRRVRRVLPELAVWYRAIAEAHATATLSTARHYVNGGKRNIVASRTADQNEDFARGGTDPAGIPAAHANEVSAGHDIGC